MSKAGAGDPKLKKLLKDSILGVRKALALREESNLSRIIRELFRKKGDALPRVHQIFVDLLEGIAARDDLDDADKLTKINYIAKIGEKDPGLFLANAQKLNPLTDLGKDCAPAQKPYTDYCNDLRKDFKGILTQYQGYLEGRGFFKENKLTPFAGSLYHAIYGHFYDDGSLILSAEKRVLVELLDRLARINSTYISELDIDALLPEDRFFGKDQQLALVKKMTADFTEAQEVYYQELKLNDEKDLEKIFYRLREDDKKRIRVKDGEEYVSALWQADSAELLAFYNRIVYGSEETSKIAIAELTFVSEEHPEGQYNLTLVYELKQIRAEKLQVLEGLQHQTKELKKCMQHFSQQLGLGSFIQNKVNLDGSIDARPYEVTEKPVALTPEKAEKKRKDRRTKGSNRWFATLASLVIGFGEGLVAAVAIAAMFPAVPFVLPLLVAGLAGWWCNYFLMRSDTINMLGQFTLTGETNDGKPMLKFFIDKDGNEVTGWRKWLGWAFAGSAAATGIVYGCLSFLSVKAAFLALGAGVGLAATVACFPAVATAIGLACILGVVICNFVKNDGWNTALNYFKNTYGNRPWKEMNGWDRAGWAGHVLFSATKLALALGINIVVTVASFGMLHDKSIEVMNGILNAKWANITGWAVAGINAVTHYLFSHINIHAAISRFTGFVANTAAAVFSGLSSLFSKKPSAGQVAQQNVKPKPVALQRAANAPGQLAEFLVDPLFALANGGGQGTLVAPQADTTAGAIFLGGTTTGYSGGPNIQAMAKVRQQSAVWPEPRLKDLPNSTGKIAGRLGDKREVLVSCLDFEPPSEVKKVEHKVEPVAARPLSENNGYRDDIEITFKDDPTNSVDTFSYGMGL